MKYTAAYKYSIAVFNQKQLTNPLFAKMIEENLYPEQTALGGLLFKYYPNIKIGTNYYLTINNMILITNILNPIFCN